MMGTVWCAMLCLSIFGAIFRDNLGSLTPAAMEGAQTAITLCISLTGALCLWCGIAKVMEKGGLTKKLGRLLRPIFCRLFPLSSQDEITLGYLTANMAANLLGLGNAATPMGVAAVKRMHTKPGIASDEMCLLVVMNTASIQLLPTTVAALRASLGASAPFDILPGVWLTSILSVSAGICAAKCMRRFFKHA